MHNVLVLASALYEGGAERVIEHLATRLDRSRFAVTIGHLQDRGNIGDALAARGYDVVAIACARTGVRRFLSARALARVARERRIDLLHTHTTGALADGALCRLGSFGRIKLVHTFHFGNYPHYPSRYLRLERAAARAANHLVAVGVEQMAVLGNLHGGRVPMTAVLNGSETPSAAVDAEWAARLAADGRIVIGTTAVCIEQKGLDYLLDVAARFKAEGIQAVFVVAGEGPLRARLELRSREMGLEGDVLFTGWKVNAGATITPLFDVFFQPSLWEAMSVVVLEAMAAGKPVVATGVGENRHVVIDGTTGFVVPPRDVAAMADRLRRLVASASARRALGAAGRARFEARYTAAAMARAYEDIYETVLTGATAVPAVSKNDSHPCTT